MFNNVVLLKNSILLRSHFSPAEYNYGEWFSYWYDRFLAKPFCAGLMNKIVFNFIVCVFIKNFWSAILIVIIYLLIMLSFQPSPDSRFAELSRIAFQDHNHTVRSNERVKSLNLLSHIVHDNKKTLERKKPDNHVMVNKNIYFDSGYKQTPSEIKTQMGKSCTLISEDNIDISNSTSGKPGNKIYF